jgi:tetratricopeptide (TPR) repeat protein
MQSGTLPETATALERSLADYKAKGDEAQAATLANDLGVVYFLLGRYGRARAMLEDARDAFVKAGDAAGQARTLGNLAQIEDRRGDKRAALAMYQQAVDLFRSAHDRAGEYDTQRALSQLFLKQGDWIQALAAYERALAVKPHATLFDAILRAIYQIPLRLMGIHM